jgi:hypothetical protein
MGGDQQNGCLAIEVLNAPPHIPDSEIVVDEP